jgi:chorismate mutase/prephenate dehydratase
MIEVSKPQTLKRKVAYQGVDGSNSHEVASAYFVKVDELLKYSSFKEVFESVECGESDYGILPIENSYTGSINEIYDYLGKSDIKIVGEYIIDIRHNLMAKKGAKLDQIKKVYSHPQGFLQSKEFLNQNSHMEQVSYHNTAISAKYVSISEERDIAAIASKSAANIYGLDIIKSNINDQDENKTKFIIISKEYSDSQNNNKITLMFNVSHKAGVLHKVLSHLSHNELNISKIESRPIDGKEWEYSFYMDIVGNIKSKKIEYVLRLIENEVIDFKLLGCYKAYK